jgi:hypothetical protein
VKEKIHKDIFLTHILSKPEDIIICHTNPLIEKGEKIKCTVVAR